MHYRRILLAAAVALVFSTAAWAQAPVPELRDLMGVRAAGGETQLQQRGYTNVGGEKVGGSSMTYWRHDGDNSCIVVTTTDGRYAAINHAPATKCSGDSGSSPEGSGDPNEFETVCGVIVDGETYRYLCYATVHTENGRRTRTVVRYPDITFTFNWHDDRNVGVKSEGTATMRGTYSISEGETDVFFDDKTYFFISNQQAAAQEVAAFKRDRR